MASENPRDEGVASGQTFIFTHQEINYVIKVLDEILEAFVEELAPESTVILLTELLKRFNKAKFNNLIEVPIELDGKDLEMLVFDLEMIEMDILVDVWAPGGMSAEEYEEMALCCTILAKLIEDPEDSGGGSAAAT